MELETNLKLSLLTELYKNLLTNKQQQMLKDFLDNNLSITELATEYNTSRQAINDLLKRTFKVLEDYENKLGLLNKFQQIEKSVATCKDLIDEDINNAKIKDQLKRQLNNILEVM